MTTTPATAVANRSSVCNYVHRMQRTAEGSVFGAVSLCFLFVYEISRERLNEFATNSQGRRVWSLARTSLKVKVKRQRSRSPGTKKRIFDPFGDLRAVYVL